MTGCQNGHKLGKPYLSDDGVWEAKCMVCWQGVRNKNKSKLI